MGVALLKGFCELRQRLGCPLAALRAAAAVAEIADLEDGLMEQLLLLCSAGYARSSLGSCPLSFSSRRCSSPAPRQTAMIDLLQILVAKDDVLPRPVPVYIGRRELPVIVPDASPAHHAGNRCSDTSHPSFPLPCFSVFVLLSFYHTSTD